MAKAVGDPLARYWTYKKIIELAKIVTGSITDPNITDVLCLDIVNSKVAEAATGLNGVSSPYYSTTVATNLDIVGSANPYTTDLSSFSPFFDKIKEVTYVVGSTRYPVLPATDSISAEALVAQDTHTAALLYVVEGDTLKLFFGATYATVSTNHVEVTYYRQPTMSTTAALTDNPDILDKFTPLVFEMTISEILRHKTEPITDSVLDTGIDTDVSILQKSYMTKE